MVILNNYLLFLLKILRKLITRLKKLIIDIDKINYTIKIISVR